MKIITLLFAVLLTTPGVVNATGPADVEEVLTALYDGSVALTARRGEQVVFIQDGMRYTVWHSVKLDSESLQNEFVSFWVRPDGTAGNAALVTFTDSGFDGVVDFGIKDLPFRKYYGSGDFFTKRGTEYQQYWQDQYDAAITAARKYIGK